MSIPKFENYMNVIKINFNTIRVIYISMYYFRVHKLYNYITSVQYIM